MLDVLQRNSAEHPPPYRRRRASTARSLAAQSRDHGVFEVDARSCRTVHRRGWPGDPTGNCSVVSWLSGCDQWGKIDECRGVAQPGSASALGAGGRQFESDRPDQHNLLRIKQMPRLCLAHLLFSFFDCSQFCNSRRLRVFPVEFQMDTQMVRFRISLSAFPWIFHRIRV